MENTFNATPSRKRGWLTPLAIIIVGILIAAAIFFRTPAGSGKADITGALSPEDVRSQLISFASDAGVKKRAFTACLDEGSMAARVSEDDDEILKASNNTAGTPFLVFEFSNGKHIAVPGAIPQQLIEQIIKDKKLPSGFPDTKIGEFRSFDSEGHVLGAEKPTVTIIEWSDLDCPFCKQIHPELQGAVGSDETLAWEYRHHPLDTLHPNARLKAEASECVAELGGNEAFWKFIDAVIAT